MSAVASFEVGEPILNSPFEEPAEHWLIEEGRVPERRAGRRPAGYFYRDPRAADEAGSVRGVWEELELVNLIRQRLGDWRAERYPGATRTTRELLDWWRRDGRKHRLFFAQLEAAETVIFLREARSDLLQGIDVPPELDAGGLTRYGCKMATGAGKTMVMGMLAAWSILNKLGNRSDARFSDVVLVVCPNVTIRNRLAELDPNRGDASIYRARDLVPPHLMPTLRRGRVLVKNWHEFERKRLDGGARVVKAGVAERSKVTIHIGDKTTTARGKRYFTKEDFDRHVALGFLRPLGEVKDNKVDVEETKHLESETASLARILGREIGGKQNILVLNDEAHHAYRIRHAQPDEAEDAESLDEDREEELIHESTVWIDGLDRIHKHRGINLCVDLSATPYYLARAGENKNRVFPWVVSDFGLTDAIESGLVKIPQLAVADPTGAPDPQYFNLWRTIMNALSPRERGGKKANPKPEAVLEHAHIPIQILGDSWEEEVERWAQLDDERRPPVFILVCKNTRLAKVAYDWIAEGKPPPKVPPIGLPGLRNTDGTIYTIRVDSKVVGETDTEGVKSDESTWMRLTLDTVGKERWPTDEQGRPIYPEGFRELAEKFGRPLHPPGRDVRCIVSVGMLTEGWDCNTVTHIIGLRPFMSQLLCEQVVGRGLRRRDYEVGADGKLVEEVAKVLGVPFEVIPFKQRSGKPPPKTERRHVQALPEKSQFEIRFPRVEGYTQSIRSRVAVDWDSVAQVRIDPMEIPHEVMVKAAIPANKGKPSLIGPGKLEELNLERWRADVRLQEHEFEMAAALTRAYAEQPSCEVPPQLLFPQIIDVVKRFVRDKVEVVAKAEKVDVFLSPYYGDAIDRLVQAIHPDHTHGEAPELPVYEQGRPAGSTADVDLWTSKEVREVVKSHLNYAVADTKQWEQAAAYRIDNHPGVEAFVKNEGLGFAIPYLHDGQSHDYIPDFVIRLDSGMQLILETKGYDPVADVKEQAARRWVDAVNAEGSYGEWRYEIVRDMGAIGEILDRA